MTELEALNILTELVSKLNGLGYMSKGEFYAADVAIKKLNEAVKKNDT
jgi:hypothetical protein